MHTHSSDDRPVIWDERNRKHLSEDHPERRISLREIDEVLADPARLEVYLADREEYQVAGKTNDGRWLVVVWIDQPQGRYPIHARSASKRLLRRLTG